MIVLRSWLEEFIDLKDITLDEIVDTLNKIGHEVEGYRKIEIADNVVVGEVIECKKHPDADKLNVCKVNVGDEVLQIVCGAKNVKAGQFVPVAKIGAKLAEDFKIKKAKLRGVESFGMICSSEEISLPKLNDGILELDNSLGELKIGEYVGNYLNDEIIDLGITANRGDALSIYGIARELSAALNKDLKRFEANINEINEGIGRIVKIDKNNLKYASSYIRAVSGEIESNLKIDLRLALCEIEAKNVYEKFEKYTMHATGVLTVISNICNIELVNIEDVDTLKAINGKYLFGIKKELNVETDNKFLINTNFAPANIVNEIAFVKNLKGDDYFYRASRGSEPDIKFGMNYILNELNLDVYSGYFDFSMDYKEKFINFSVDEIRNIIGEKIEEEIIVNILKKLKFEFRGIENGYIKVKIPLFRSDIENIQDIAEEILRIYGIDKIKAKPLYIKEQNRINDTIKEIEFLNSLRERAVSQGFYEVLHFVFDSKERLKKYGFEVVDDNLDLINPIASELNTLRTTTILQLLDDVKFNKANGYKNIYLFTIGSVYNKNREESLKLGIVVSGFKERENITNSAKPSKVDFKFIVDKLSSIIGEFELINRVDYDISHPYQSGVIIKDNKEIGVVSKLHPKVAKDFDLDEVFFAEIDLYALPIANKKAKDINRFQKVIRDLSLVVSKELSYKEILDDINELNIKEIVEFYPIDIFDLGDNNSLTLRFVIQGNKTLTDDEINAIINQILNKLAIKGITLR